jgi:hypothetical protein
MRIEQIGNGFLVLPDNNTGFITTFYYPTLAAIESAMMAAQRKAAAPDAGSNLGAAPTTAAPGAVASVSNIADAAKKRGRPAKTSSPESPGSGAAADAGSGSPQPAAPTAVDPTTALQVQAAMSELIAKHGLSLTKDALSRFGAKKFGDLKPEQYTDFVVLVRTAIETGRV